MHFPMAKPVLTTKEGYDKMVKELERLKGHERARIAEAIREAKSHGDLRENAAYHEAKLNQTRLEHMIAELERNVLHARIVERPPDADGVAHLGSTVTLLDLEFNDELTIKLVGTGEANVAHDLVSITSPMGEAILDKREGDEIEVTAPAGTIRYRIVKLEME